MNDYKRYHNGDRCPFCRQVIEGMNKEWLETFSVTVAIHLYGEWFNPFCKEEQEKDRLSKTKPVKWETRQLLVLAEALGDLMKALCRLVRADSEGKQETAREEIIEQSARVSALLAGMQTLLGIEDEVQARITDRIEREKEKTEAGGRLTPQSPPRAAVTAPLSGEPRRCGSVGNGRAQA